MSDVRRSTRVPVEKLRWTCDTEALPAPGTRSLPPVQGTIGQDRALRALKVGLELYAPGYNVFVSGLTGTGRATTVKQILQSISPRCSVSMDRAFVHNFADPQAPTLLTLPAGRAAELARAMTEFSSLLRQQLPRLFEDKVFAEQRSEIVMRFGEAERSLLKAFTEKVQQDGFTVAQVQVGPFQRPEVLPVHEGQPMPIDGIRQAVEQGVIPEAEGRRLLEKYDGHREELQEVLAAIRANSREMLQEVQTLLRESARILIEGHLTDIRRRFPGQPRVQEYVDAVEGDVLDEMVVLPAHAEGAPDTQEWTKHIEAHLAAYTVNVLIDRTPQQGCAVVVENFPTFTNLFGSIERVPVGPGVWAADHRHIKAGSLLKADGGYLLISARDVLTEPGVWNFLKAALRSHRLEIQVPPAAQLMGPAMLKPEPIKINVKVILVGEPGMYGMLFAADPDFRKIFKVKADFDASMDLSLENVGHFACVVARICEKEDLLPLDREALAACAEMAVRDAGRQDRISTRFNEVADVVREASFWAREEGAATVTREHVHRAIDERADRHGLMEDKLQGLMVKDVLMIDTDGSNVGQINGLSVYQIGYHSFGKPTRITAATSAGGVGIINVEREARLSGGIYDKGVLIISGWMRRMFAQDRRLALTASLCFEQSYSGVDGDSASVAEICALLSELSEIPIDASFAVTGSINQHGEVQPIGGVNEKIEGFFDLCRARGLTGRQGCVIPTRNVADLMLKPEIVRAVADGTFHVHAVGTAEEAIELLTGTPAGGRDEHGEFPEGTVYAAVEAKLDRYASRARSDETEMDPTMLAAERGAAAAEPQDPPATEEP